MPTPGTAATGSPRDIGSVSVGSGAPTYLGADGQTHQYIGQNAAGTWQYDSNYPPAPAGSPGAGGSGAGGSGAGGSGAGLVESFQPLIGKLELGTAILAVTAAAVLVGLEVVTVGAAVFWLGALLGIDAGVGVLSSAAEWVEHFFGGDPNEPGISPITKLARQISKALGLGGLMGDFVMTATICGTIYFVSHRQGQSRIEIFRPARTNPPARRLRGRRRVRPAVRLLK